MNKGIWNALGAYSLWGLLPVYWKLLHHVSAFHLIGHRIVWSCVTLCVVIAVSRQWKDFRTSVGRPGVLRVYLMSALLIGVNWLTYIWAVNSGHVLESSLGYFINPLVSVLIGVVFLRERLRPWQWVPVGLAAAGVLYLTVVHGSLPWIALTLAVSFGFYGLVKKKAPLGSLFGLTLETAILLPAALVYLAFIERTGEWSFFNENIATIILVFGMGLVTTVPLLLFASAAKRIPLSLIGILQYISPSLQFLMGILVFHESFTRDRFIGFAIVWIALVIFGVESWTAYKKRVDEKNELWKNSLETD